MEKMILFSLIVAWPAMIFCALVGAATLQQSLTYEGSIRELQDQLEGKRRTYRPLRFIVIALVCLAWIICNFVI